MYTLESIFNRTLFLSFIAALAVSSAVAQDAPPADPPAEPTPAAEPAAEPEEEAAPVKTNRHAIVIGYTTWLERNNTNKFQQYGSPAKGFGVRQLDLLYPAKGNSPFFRFNYSGEIHRDQVAAGKLIFANGRGQADFEIDQRHYFDPSPVITSRSSRRGFDVDLTYALNNDLGVYWQARQETHDKYRLAPADPQFTITKGYAGGIQGKLLGGHLGVGISDQRFYDRTNEQPKTVLKKWGLEYSHSLGDQATAGVTYNQTRIEQTSREPGHIRSAGFNLAFDYSAGGSIFLSLKRDDIKLPMVANATDRRRISSAVRIVQDVPKGRLELGYQRRSNERFRRDQLFVDVPSWDVIDGRFSGKLLDGLRFTLKGSYEHLRSRPQFQTEDDARSLYWDDRVRLSALVTGGTDRFNGYLSYQFRYDENSPREVEIRRHTVALGGSYTFNESTSGYFEMLNETAKADGVVDELGYALDLFFPSWTSLALGFDHVMNPKDSVSFALNHYFTNNQNPHFEAGGNVRGMEMTLQYWRKLSDAETLHLLIAPWRFDDKTDASARYRVTVMSISFGLKF